MPKTSDVADATTMETAASVSEVQPLAECVICQTPTPARLSLSLGTERCNLGHLHAVMEEVALCSACQGEILNPEQPLTNYAVIVAGGLVGRYRELTAASAAAPEK
jgi:hypothetical protein